MLTKNDLIYFVDPLTDPMRYTKPEHLLVLDKFNEYGTTYSGRGPAVGEVANLDPGKFRLHQGTIFFEAKNKEGEDVNIAHRYVTGALANFTVRSYDQRRLIGILPDGFIYGRGVGSRTLGDGRMSVAMRDVRRSDQRSTMLGDTALAQSAPFWVEAAPWTERFFPLATDDAETVELKLSLAKEQYRQRRNKTVLLREAAQRGWVRDVEEMREDNADYFPAPRFGMLVNGKATIGSVPVDQIAEHLPSRLNDARTAFAEQPRVLPNTARVNVQYDIEFFARTEVSIDQVGSVNDSLLANEAYENFGYAASYNSFSKTPILRTAV